MHTDVSPAQRHDGRVALNDRSFAARPLELKVNGKPRTIELEPRVSLLDALREHLCLTGSKKGCDQGTSGACTVWVDGRRVLAGLTLAAACENRELTKIEGLAAEGEPHPMQRAFIEHDAFPVRLLHAGPDHVRGHAARGGGNAATDDDIAEFMRGNICRCAAYPNVRLPSGRCARVAGAVTMRPLAYGRVDTVEDAVALVGGDPASAFLAGGRWRGSPPATSAGRRGSQ